ncbi:hypothetical protein Vi05172_g11118 [Venturia inaequalis]|nr:hypothetical protein Vi05172_g11118 [Venturia inaequalis]
MYWYPITNALQSKSEKSGKKVIDEDEDEDEDKDNNLLARLARLARL